MSSATHYKPSRPSSDCCSLVRKISEDTLHPNGILSQRYLPNGVLKVVSLLDSSSNTTCQYAFFTSSVENSFALDSSGRISSNTGKRKCSRLRALFKHYGSKHTRRSPFFFIVTTRLLTQSVGSCIGVITF